MANRTALINALRLSSGNSSLEAVPLSFNCVSLWFGWINFMESRVNVKTFYQATWRARHPRLAAGVSPDPGAVRFHARGRAARCAPSAATGMVAATPSTLDRRRRLSHEPFSLCAQRSAVRAAGIHRTHVRQCRSVRNPATAPQATSHGPSCAPGPRVSFRCVNRARRHSRSKRMTPR